VFSAMWGQPDWRVLTPDAQWMYLALLSQADLAQDGVISLRVSRWAKLADGLTTKDVQCRLDELESAGYVVVDDETGELLIRSLIRWDRVYLQPNVMRAAVSHLATVESPAIRWALRSELARIMQENTVEARLTQGEKPLTDEQQAVLRKAWELLSPSERVENALTSKDNPSRNPSANPSREGFADPSANPPLANPSGNPSANPLGDRGEVLRTKDQSQNQDQSQTLFPFPAENGVIKSAKRSTAARNTDDPLFGEFYNCYPRKKEPVAARKAWDKAVKAADPRVIIEAARRYAAEREGQDPQYTPYPARWLNAGGFRSESDPRPPVRASGGFDARAADFDAMRDRLRADPAAALIRPALTRGATND
jgi:hypothetical protein